MQKSKGWIPRPIVCAKDTTAPNASPSFLLTVSSDRPNLSVICLWLCLVPHAHRCIPKASMESHCNVGFSHGWPLPSYATNGMHEDRDRNLCSISYCCQDLAIPTGDPSAPGRASDCLLLHIHWTREDADAADTPMAPPMFH